jgi:heme O synthase-like polyprenyltransferase
MQTFNTKSNISVYYELTKPKIWYLLVFTAFGAAQMFSTFQFPFKHGHYYLEESLQALLLQIR